MIPRRRLALIALALAWPVAALGGTTDVLPRGAFLFNFGYSSSEVRGRFNGSGELKGIVDPVTMMEPTGTAMGTLVPSARVDLVAAVYQLFYGVTDDWTLGMIVPVVQQTQTHLDLKWIPGAYDPALGRPYSASDFWAFAQSMGQPKPGDETGNQGVLGDAILGTKVRLHETDDYVVGALGFVDLQTGRPPDPENLTGVGATGYDFGTNGDLGLHLTWDWKLPEPLRGRLTPGGDVFYEYFWTHVRKTPTGVIDPLLLTEAPYVGPSYRFKPGDYWGGSVGTDVTILKGPSALTWITRADPSLQEKLPALLVVNATYQHVRLEPTIYRSQSPQWDWERDSFEPGGYRNTVSLTGTLSLFKLGAPVNLYANYMNQEWIPGRNFRPVVAWMGGVQLLAKLP